MNCESSVDVVRLVVVLIGRRTRDVIDRLSVMHFDQSFVRQMSVGGLSIVCLSCCCNKLFVRCR